jgi:hypothetical protein
MTNTNVPKDGDFASYLEEKARREEDTRHSKDSNVSSNGLDGLSSSVDSATRQTINDVLINGQEPTDEFLEELNALENAPGLSDEELEQQALSDPGADGDVGIPE